MQVADVVGMRGEPVGERLAIVVGIRRTTRSGCRWRAGRLPAPAGASSGHRARGGTVAAENAARSRSSTGAVWWLMLVRTNSLTPDLRSGACDKLLATGGRHSTGPIPSTASFRPVRMPAASRTLCFALVVASAFAPLLAAAEGDVTVPRPTRPALRWSRCWRASSRCRPGKPGRGRAAAYLRGGPADRPTTLALAERATRIAMLANDDKRRGQGPWSCGSQKGAALTGLMRSAAGRAGDPPGRRERAARKRPHRPCCRHPADARLATVRAGRARSAGARDPKPAGARAGRAGRRQRHSRTSSQAWLEFGRPRAGAWSSPSWSSASIAEVVRALPGRSHAWRCCAPASCSRPARPTRRRRSCVGSRAARPGNDPELRNAVAIADE